jgi:ParB-like chromosome segregation protein Spo0J
MAAKAVPVYEIGGKRFTTLFADQLRPLSPQELEDLEESAELRGVLVLVICDERYGIIDGRHRLQVACALGLKDIPYEVRKGLSKEQKRRTAVELKLAGRRVRPEDRQVLAVALRKQGMSYRDIGSRPHRTRQPHPSRDGLLTKPDPLPRMPPNPARRLGSHQETPK